MIKSNNAPTQCKNKYAFKSFQLLVNKYNLAIVRVYDNAGHGKGLIDAMSSFGVKSILRGDIVALDNWFANNLDICEYLTLTGDTRMSYNHIYVKVLDEVLRVSESMVVDKCISGHIFVYKPNSSSIYVREYLFSGSNYLKLKLENCESLITSNFNETVADLNQCENESNNSKDECALEEDFEDGNNQNVF